MMNFDFSINSGEICIVVVNWGWWGTDAVTECWCWRCWVDGTICAVVVTDVAPFESKWFENKGFWSLSKRLRIVKIDQIDLFIGQRQFWRKDDQWKIEEKTKRFSNLWCGSCSALRPRPNAATGGESSAGVNPSWAILTEAKRREKKMNENVRRSFC